MASSTADHLSALFQRALSLGRDAGNPVYEERARKLREAELRARAADEEAAAHGLVALLVPQALQQQQQQQQQLTTRTGGEDARLDAHLDDGELRERQRRRFEEYHKAQQGVAAEEDSIYAAQLAQDGYAVGEQAGRGGGGFDYLIPRQPLTPEESRLCREISLRDSGDVVCERFNADITKHCFATLDPSEWLNDEVVNAFIKMVAAKRGGTRPDRPHVFDSFFLTLLLPKGVYDYSQVQRQTLNRRTNIDLFQRRAVIFPVNCNNVHWCLCVADMRAKQVIYFDSMGGGGEATCGHILHYLQDEHQTRKNQQPLEPGWQLSAARRLCPQQDNSNDCGVFTSYFAKVLIEYFLTDTSGSPPPFTIFPFSCADTPRLRQQMKLDILQDQVYSGDVPPPPPIE